MLTDQVYSLTGANFCSAAFSKYWMTGLSSSIPDELRVGMLSSLTCPAPVRLELSNNRSMYSSDNPLLHKKKRQDRKDVQPKKLRNNERRGT